MSAAIHTRYSAAGRIIATAKDGKGNMRLSVPYDFELHHSKRHPAAAKALATRLGWRGLWIVGHNEDNSICAAQLGGSFSRAWINKYICGIEGEDYFVVTE